MIVLGERYPYRRENLSLHRGGPDGPALRLPAPGPRRTRLASLAGLARGDDRGVGVRAVAARALREERQAAAGGLRRPARRRVLRRPRTRPGRAGHDVAAGPPAD